MQVRGARRRRAIDRGFVLSDHVDWPALLGAIEATGAWSVWWRQSMPAYGTLAKEDDRTTAILSWWPFLFY